MNTLDSNRLNKSSIIKVAGAYVAWVMGSGFATGQEILQFFTSYGYKSFILLAINLLGFLIIGPKILKAGSLHRDDPDFNHFNYFCGTKLGWFYSWFLPLSMFAGMVILVSGAGATLEEYYGLNHYVGALLMASLALAAYFAGFQRFVKVVSFIGPTIIAFSLIVGIVTLIRDFDGLAGLGESLSKDPAAAAAMQAKQPVPFWWLSGLLYISYNLCGGSKYYSALGATGGGDPHAAQHTKEVFWGAIVGTVALMASILLMSSAMLTDIGVTATLDVPTLYLARLIAWPLGAVFSIILIMGIFSSCSAMLWTISEKFVVQGTRKSRIFAVCVCIAAFLLGLLPFSNLVGSVYTFLGYVGLIFAACVVIKKMPKTK